MPEEGALGIGNLLVAGVVVTVLDEILCSYKVVLWTVPRVRSHDVNLAMAIIPPGWRRDNRLLHGSVIIVPGSERVRYAMRPSGVSTNL